MWMPSRDLVLMPLQLPGDGLRLSLDLPYSTGAIGCFIADVCIRGMFALGAKCMYS